MIKEIVKSRYFYRIAESIIPIFTWVIITLPLWLSPFRPAVVSYFILAFFLYFLYKSVRNIYYAAISYKLMTKSAKINWYKKLLKTKNWQKIIHYIVITNHRESAQKLEKTINKIKEQQYPKEKINIILAVEAREGLDAYKRSRILENKFKSDFAGFHTVYHYLKNNEVMGKASNETCAVKFIDRKIKKLKINPENILITICDADSLLPKNYLAYLTNKYLSDKERRYHFYWAPVVLYSNFWRLPLPVRVQSILSSILRLAFLSQKKDLIQISTYSTSLWLLCQVNFWDVNIIPEDWHIWLQAFFKFGEKVRTIPLYLPINADAVLSKGLLNTLKNRYIQERRWAWGATDIPYAIKRFFETPHIPVFLKLRKILLLVETHLFWPTSFFILTLSASIPPLINPVFKRTVMGFLLPKLSSLILTASSLLLIFILYFDYKMREKVNVKTKISHVPLLFIQWYFLPIISFLFSSLPALEAHTRLLMGKKLEYKVTEKI
jgi:hypothetical protein